MRIPNWLQVSVVCLPLLVSGCTAARQAAHPPAGQQLSRESAPPPRSAAPVPEAVTPAEPGAPVLALLATNLGRPAADPLPAVPHSLKPLDLSRPPTRDELMAAGQLGGQLYPTHALADPAAEAEVNASFGAAIQLWNRHEYRQAVALFKEHIARYPDSPWVAEAQLHMGCDAQYTGRYSEAEELFSSLIATYGGKEADGAQKMANKALLRLAVLRTFQNNFEEAEKLFAALIRRSGNWREQTYASHWIQRIASYNAEKTALMNCGTLALARVLEQDGKAELAGAVRKIVPKANAGQSLEELRVIASLYGYSFAGFRVAPEKLAEIPLPAIVRLPARAAGDSGHYWVLERVADGYLHFFDAQAGRIFTQTTAQFGREWGGEVLVLQDHRQQVAFGERLSDSEIAGSFGGCCGVPAPPSNLGDPGNKNDPCGAPAWSVNPVNLNLFLRDVPLWYSSPIGPSVEIALSYNSQSAIAQHEPFGDKWQFNYASYLVVDTGGQVTVFMPDGRHDIYSPNGSGGYLHPSGVFNSLVKLAENHFTLTFRDGTVYEYNIPAGTTSLQPFLVKISDAFGQSLTMGYDANINLTTITDALGRSTALTYTGTQVTRVTDPSGRFATFEYTGTQLTKITDMGGYATTLSYDAKVNVTSIGNSRGTWQFLVEPADGTPNGSNPFPPPGATMWQNARVTVTDPTGKSELFAYNGYSHYGWHASPNYFVPYLDPSNNSYASPTVKKTRYNYTTVNGQGMVASVVHPDGGTEQYSYDSATGLRNGITDPHGHLTSYQYNAMGEPLSVTDAMLQVTTMSYGTNGVDLTGVINGLGTVAATYDTHHKITSVTDRLGKTISFAYNGFGQLTTVTDPLGRVTTYSYFPATDPSKYLLQQVSRGGVVLESFTYDPKGRMATRSNASGTTLIFAYDNLDRVTTVTWPDSKTETFTYSGCCPKLLDSYTDRTGRIVSLTYDANQRLIEKDYPDGSLLRFRYDADGNLVALIDGNSNTTRFAYDPLDRLVQKVYADGSAVSYAYDVGGLLTSRTGGRGITASYSFDANHNRTAVGYSDTTPSVSWTYDPYNRIVARTDGTGSYSYGYDANSHLTSLNGPLSAETISFTYDALGRRTAQNLQGADPVSYTYDGFDRLTVLAAGSRHYTFAYPEASASPDPVSLTRPNGSVTTLVRDALHRLTGMSTAKNTAAVVLSDSFSYNTQDQRGSETVTNGLASPTLTASLVAYNYNNLNQLLASTSPSRTYSYDADGNLVGGYTPAGYPFAAAYDGANRLTSLDYTDGSAVAHHLAFTYNGAGRLSRQVVDGVTTNFVGSGLTLLQERDAANTATRTLLWDPRSPGGVGGLLEIGQGGALYNPFYDGQGNVRGLLDAGQNVAQSYTFDPYGAPLVKSGTVDQPYRFSTKMYDEKSGLLYYGHRFYAPVLGRWLSRDPLGEVGGINLYGFVDNNPLSFVDPDGEFGIGLNGGGEAEAGVGGGLAVQANSGVGVFGGNGHLSLGGYTASGGFADNAKSDQFVVGASAGLGVGVFLTNADCAKQLLGPFDTWTLNLPWVSFQFAISGDTWTAGASVGKSYGFSLSRYSVDTTAAGDLGY